MTDRYVYREGRMLRCGYTTGSCAAAAAKAAAVMLLSGETVSTVELMTPKGVLLTLDVHEAKTADGYAECAVRKDSGDDPDITNGILVFAKVSKAAKGVLITGGVGIGKVTKAGLDRPVGDWAINSVPRKMIENAVAEVGEMYDFRGGFEVEISIPDGEELAKRTYNPRLGITGGLSVIGTSGIIEPMSNAALVDTIRTEAKMRRAEGHESILLTLGNYSESFVAREMPFDTEKSVKCSNFIGDAIDIALELGFGGILIVGHIGKLVKLGAGIMNTRSSNADGRMDVLVTCGVLGGADTETLKKLPDCATADAALDILDEAGYLRETLDVLAKRAGYYLAAKVKDTVPAEAVMFSDKRGILVKTSGADEMIKRIEAEYNG